MPSVSWNIINIVYLGNDAKEGSRQSFQGELQQDNDRDIMEGWFREDMIENISLVLNHVTKEF